jgi:hypothetical protein
MTSKDELQVHGRERGVRIPIRIRNEYHSKASRIKSQRKLRRMLLSVPIYVALLNEFPDATIISS